jgi:NAD(P)-dependent dehydrogenase (short-subunit alcohol dehydrogenase family)
MTSTETKTWLVTGAGRGMGADLARAALAAGHNVVATGRTPATVSSTIGEHERLHVTELDITDAQSAERAVAAAVQRFGGIEPFGIRAMIVEPGFFRTELLEPTSTTFAELSIADYAERTRETIPQWEAMNGRQAGDPAKLAEALVQLADSDDPPLRWVAGEDAVERIEDKARLVLAQVDAHRELSTSLAHDDAGAVA